MMKNFSGKTRFAVLWILSLINFILHFIKVYTDGINGFNSRIYYVSLSNFCSINTVILPFILLFKNRVIKDFMTIMCLISGIVAMLFCYCLEGENGFSNHTIRFFITHLILFLIPFELLRFNLIKLNYKNVKWCYLFFFVEQGIIYLNDVVLFKFNIIPYQHYSNSSLVYGIRDDVNSMFGFIKYLVPDIFIINGEYIPIVWLLVPMVLVMMVTYIVVILFFDKEHYIEGYREYKLLKVLKKYNL